MPNIFRCRRIGDIPALDAELRENPDFCQEGVCSICGHNVWIHTSTTEAIKVHGGTIICKTTDCTDKATEGGKYLYGGYTTQAGELMQAVTDFKNRKGVSNGERGNHQEAGG